MKTWKGRKINKYTKVGISKLSQIQAIDDGFRSGLAKSAEGANPTGNAEDEAESGSKDKVPRMTTPQSLEPGNGLHSISKQTLSKYLRL